MKFDFVYHQNSYSTYFLEKGPICSSSIINAARYRVVEKSIANADSYLDLVKQYEIRALDNNTGLKEIKIDRIRVIHFIFNDDTFVFLGTFLKKTRKTPPNEIAKNNKRIEQYLSERNNENE